MNVESLEGRQLMSVAFPKLPANLNLSPAMVNRLSSHGLAGIKLPKLPGGSGSNAKVDPIAVGLIADALMGRGPGAEFGSLIRGQIRNVASVISGFASGKTREYTTPGIAVRLPNVQENFQYQHYDHVKLTAAGVVLQRDGRFQMGAVVQGPYDENLTSQVIFGIDRGAGKRLGPLYPQRPKITPDALVELTIGPYGQSASGQIRDLTTGAVTPIDPQNIIVAGATVRVFINPAQLPGQGNSTKNFKFSTWTRHGTTGGIESIGSFVPDKTMIAVGVAKK